MMAYLAILMPYVVGVLGGVIIGIPIGRIQGAERVSRGHRGDPDETPTVTACRTCWKAVKDCRCLKVMRAVGRA
jgi:hypothetical protein